jgi:hypothetical protein
MADETKDPTRGFPNPDDFDSYDEVESEDGQAELPEDNYEESVSNAIGEGCECD